jgi:hypothetical protein
MHAGKGTFVVSSPFKNSFIGYPPFVVSRKNTI